LGFNRTITGSNALSQYKPEVQKAWEDVKTVDDKLLLWFHHVPWGFTMKSGRTMWNELCYKYYTGTDSVAWMQQVWNKQAGKIDTQRFTQVRLLLKIQQEEALWWRNACLLYFQTFSRQPIPAEYEQPDRTLEYYKSLKFPYAPGNPPFSL
jgi:alpha-glucuronidase